MTTVPPSLAPRQGLSAIAIIGLCCLGTVVIVGIIGIGLIWRIDQNAPRFSPPAATHNELEFVSSNEATGEILLRDKKTGTLIKAPRAGITNGKVTLTDADGKVTTMNLIKIASGQKLLIQAPDGETMTSSTMVDTSPLPAWIPVYPGDQVPTESVTHRNSKVITGSRSFITADPLMKVKQFYEAKFKESGYDIRVTNGVTDGNDTVTGSKDSGKYSVSAWIRTEDEGKTVVTIYYNEPGT
jgi:hypothetical protein